MRTVIEHLRIFEMPETYSKPMYAFPSDPVEKGGAM